VHSKVRGMFAQPRGTVLLDEETPAHSKIDATIDISLISTGVEERDTHLKSADFFDVAKFPIATFVSTNVSRSERDDVHRSASHRIRRCQCRPSEARRQRPEDAR
jgi:polyisoprenoid-binding protein YceI